MGLRQRPRGLRLTPPVSSVFLPRGEVILAKLRLPRFFCSLRNL